MPSKQNLVLLPKPQRLAFSNGQFEIQANGIILCDGNPAEIFPVAEAFQSALQETQCVEWTIRAGSAKGYPESLAVLELIPGNSIHPQGYQLRITPKRITLTASTVQGLFYGVMTTKQILRQCEGSLPTCAIQDFPDFPTRGVMLDVCRDKVPTLETLFQYVDEFAEMKINHLELYTEHTFAYRNHPGVWAQASPITGEDVLRLQAYCQKRFIELAPNQNSFGHMHRWFDVPPYSELAECPEGFAPPWGGFCGPFSLDPTNPKSLALLEDLFSDLLPYFKSSKFNVGCDETFDLGMGKSKELCEKMGKGRVYLDFLLRIYELAKRHGKTMHFWGDIILEHPELIPELPKDVVALNWGYEPDHPYKQQCPLFAKSGVPFYVCPGTYSWATIVAIARNSVANIRNAAENGLKNGATGLLNTDWGDSGHWQYMPMSYIGFAAGSAMSWAFKANKDEDFSDALNVHVFKDEAGVMGKLLYDLGNTGAKGNLALNNRALFFCLQNSFSDQLLSGFTTKDILKAQKEIETAIAPLGNAKMNRPDAAIIRDEFTNAATMLLHGCRRGLAAKDGKKASRKTMIELSNEMRVILGEHRRLWCARNRIGGLQDSAARLQDRLNEYSKLIG